MSEIERYLSGSDIQVRTYVETRSDIQEVRDILEHEARNDGRHWVIRKAKMRMRQIREYHLTSSTR